MPDPSDIFELKNPYRPGAAVAPVHLAGREPLIRTFRGILRGAPEIPANMRLTGLRGVGKSVLLKRFEEIAKEAEWAVARVQIEPRFNTDEKIQELVRTTCELTAKQLSLTTRVRERVGNMVRAARGLVNLSWNDFTLNLGASAALTESTIAEALYEVARVADSAGRHGFVLMLDEAQILKDETDRDGEHPLSLIVAAVNALQEAQVPVGLVLCGLPTLRSNLLKARTYSERMFRGLEVLGLANDHASEALLRPLGIGPVSADNELVAAVIAEVEGYPYFIQLWGAELWQAAIDSGLNTMSTALLESVQPSIYERLDSDFYEARVEALTPAEQDLLMSTASAPYPPLRTVDIRSGKTQGNVNVLMGRLADQGVVYRTSKGVYEYTAPKFHEFLGRRATKTLRRLGN
jgi:AAA ATPase domain